MKITIKQFTWAILGIAIAFSVASFTMEAPITTSKVDPQPHGYMIANYTINDQETFKKYMEAAGPLPAKYNGKVIIYNVKARTLEGNPKSVIAVAEFPSVAEAERFYNSPEYTAARKFRIASSVGSVVIAEGIPHEDIETAQPKGYMIANYTIKDQETFKKYMEAAGSLPPKYNGRVIIYDAKAKAIEGNPKTVMAVAEFTSLAEADRFYNSAEYTAARKFRIASSEGSVVLTEGLPQVSQKNEQTNSQSTKRTMSKEETEKYINATVDLFTQSTRTPILRTPDEYGMSYEDVFFSAMDGVTLEGWFIPGKSDRLIIFNHPMPANRYGYPGHLDPWKNFGGFEVNFLPEYKILHDAGYNILAYDIRNHGRSGIGSGGLLGHGLFEYRDVIGSLRYAKSRPDTKNMKVALYSRCLGANATIVGMKKHPEEFKGVKAFVALQPVHPKVFLERAFETAGIENGIDLFSKAYYNRSGLHLEQVWPMEYCKAVTIPTFVAQVHDDFLTKPSNVQEIFDTISAKDKKLFWIEGTDKRFEGYNYFGKNPQLILDWFNSHM